MESFYYIKNQIFVNERIKPSIWLTKSLQKWLFSFIRRYSSLVFQLFIKHMNRLLKEVVASGFPCIVSIPLFPSSNTADQLHQPRSARIASSTSIAASIDTSTESGLLSSRIRVTFCDILSLIHRTVWTDIDDIRLRSTPEDLPFFVESFCSTPLAERRISWTASRRAECHRTRGTRHLHGSQILRSLYRKRCRRGCKVSSWTLRPASRRPYLDVQAIALWKLL